MCEDTRTDAYVVGGPNVATNIPPFGGGDGCAAGRRCNFVPLLLGGGGDSDETT